ncbi:MAG: peptidyl-prolyl cis-trans isomerase [Lachnospiraceae bacterium]|nr:peptidyl-prolyl cis-trans isomerase [Lachnospiraceae bacterium]
MNKRNRILLLLVLVLLAGTFGGCGKKGGKDKDLPSSQGFTKDVLMRIDGKEVSYAEANIYLLSMREEVETLYGKDIWEFRFTRDGRNYSELMKDELLERIIYIKLVGSMANEFDVALGADDVLNVNDYTSNFLNHITEETAKRYGITEELVRSIYSDNILAKKVYETVTLNVDARPDENATRRSDFYYLFKTKVYKDNEGNPVTVSGEGLQELRGDMRILLENALRAEDFYKFAKDKTDAPSVEMTIGRDSFPREITDALFALPEGALSNIVETNDGLYIFYCKNKINAAETQKAEEEEYARICKEYFDELYDKWRANAKVDINNALWNAM